MPSISDGGKLLLGDAIYFDGVAWSLAEEIRSQGWGQWRLFVNTAATGNVAILGAIYAVFGHAPSFSIPISVALFVWSEPLVSFIFEGESIGNSDVINVARVLKYAMIQIPFFACNVLLLKYASATKHVMAILLVAVLGLLINIAASLLFMQYMGVAGIALGASVSMMLATIFLFMILARYRHVSLFDVVVLLLNWLLFITLLVSIHFASAPGIVVTIATYFILLGGYMKSQLSQSQPSDRTSMMRVS